MKKLTEQEVLDYMKTVIDDIKQPIEILLCENLALELLSENGLDFKIMDKVLVMTKAKMRELKRAYNG